MASAVIAIVVGPGRYVEYLEALPRMTTLATSFTGNLGLVTLSPTIALVGLVFAWVIAAFAAARMDERRGAAVALSAILLAQPTIGFNYAGVLFPAMALLWGRDRMLGTVAFVVGSLLVLVSPIGAAVLVIGLAIGSAVRSPGEGHIAGTDDRDGRPGSERLGSDDLVLAPGSDGERPA